MMGMSSLEWPRYMHDELGVDVEPPAIRRPSSRSSSSSHRRELPLLAGCARSRARLGRAPAAETVFLLQAGGHRPREARWPCGSLCRDRLVRGWRAASLRPTSTSGARRLGVAPEECARSNNLPAATAAGMTVIALPNAAVRPAE